jgi:hypothetical protein
VGLKILHGIFSYTFHIQIECEKYMRMFHGIFSIPQNIVMDLNNVMCTKFQTFTVVFVVQEILDGNHLMNLRNPQKL